MSDNKTKKPGYPPSGYKNPPKATQFKKGQSGNPAGRRKTQKTPTIPHHHDILAGLLAQKIKVKIGGKNATITKAEALLASILNSAINGSVAAQKFIMEMIEKLPFEYKRPPSTELTAEEEKLIRQVQEDARTFVYEEWTHLFKDGKPVAEDDKAKKVEEVEAVEEIKEVEDEAGSTKMSEGAAIEDPTKKP